MLSFLVTWIDSDLRGSKFGNTESLDIHVGLLKCVINIIDLVIVRAKELTSTPVVGRQWFNVHTGK